MRPLDFLGRIKAKLGIVILLAVAVAILVNEYGRYLGVPGLARMAVAGLISLAMAQLVGHGMTKPLRQMAAAAQTIAKGRYDLRVSATSRDEVGELARAFNAMAADLGEVDRQRRELVANVSHELRTPITGLQAVLENVVDGVSPPDRATLGTALAQTERLGRLVTQLLDLSRLDSGARLIEPDLFDLASLCRQAVRESRLTRDDVHVEYSVPVNVTLYADPALLAQVLANLLDNAVRHSPPGGTVLLRARIDERGAQISVTDQGPGIPLADRVRVFERFSRLDAGRTADSGGAGLGLAIAKEIVEMHGGAIKATDPGPGCATGCRMLIELPRSLIVPQSPEPALPPADPPTPYPAVFAEPPELPGTSAALPSTVAGPPEPTEPSTPRPAVAAGRPEPPGTSAALPSTVAGPPELAEPSAPRSSATGTSARSQPPAPDRSSGPSRLPDPSAQHLSSFTETPKTPEAPTSRPLASRSPASPADAGSLGPPDDVADGRPTARPRPTRETSATSAGILATPDSADDAADGTSTARPRPTGETSATSADIHATPDSADDAADGTSTARPRPAGEASATSADIDATPDSADAVEPPRTESTPASDHAKGRATMSSPTSGDDPTVRGRDEAGAAGAAAHAGGADAGDSAHAIGDIPASAARGSSAADAGEDQETGVSAGASRDATLPVTDRPTVPTQIGRRDAAATSSSGGKGLWAGDVTAEPGGAFSAAEDARNRADIGGEERGPSSGQGGAARGGTGGETGGAAPDSREVAERDLSTVDTLASGIPVTAVLGYDARQAAGPRSPFGPPPQDPAGTGSGMLGARTVLGGVLGAVVGFLGGVVLALFTAVAFESGAIALATLLFATLGGAMIGSAFGQRLSAASAPAPMSTPPSGGRPQAHRPAGPAGTARTAPEAAGTATGAERPPGAPTGTPRATGPGTSAAGMPGVRRAGPQEYVPPSLFPRPVLPKAPSWLLPAAAVVGVVAAIALPADPPGLGFVVVAALMGLAVLPAARRRVTPWSIAFAVVAYALVAFALLRDAEWLVAPLLAAGFGLGALAVSGGRGWLGVIRGGLSVPLAVFQLPWFLSEPVRRLVPRRGGASLAAGTGLTVVLVTIFAVLFASADAVFSSLLGDLFQAPAWADTLPARIFVFVVFVTLVAAAVLVALRPVAEPVMPDIRLRASRTLWMMPLIALNLLFAAFVSVQITVLFGGDERVLNTANLTYAEYARSGFFELVTVSVFVLAIVAAASGGLAVGPGRDRWWLAILLGLLCVLTLVVLTSALHRLNLYTDAYGLSRLRAAVIATSWWLAAVFVLVLVAGAVRLAHGRLAWLPRALILLTGVSLVAFAAWNPDLRVAESQHHIRGVTRLDVNYLRRLGAEAVPALDRLPEPARSCVLEGVYQSRRLYEPERSWGGWNLAREEAREIIRRKPFDRQASCPY